MQGMERGGAEVEGVGRGGAEVEGVGRGGAEVEGVGRGGAELPPRKRRATDALDGATDWTRPPLASAEAKGRWIRALLDSVRHSGHKRKRIAAAPLQALREEVRQDVREMLQEQRTWILDVVTKAVEGAAKRDAEKAADAIEWMVQRVVDLSEMVCKRVDAVATEVRTKLDGAEQGRSAEQRRSEAAQLEMRRELADIKAVCESTAASVLSTSDAYKRWSERESATLLNIFMASRAAALDPEDLSQLLQSMVAASGRGNRGAPGLAGRQHAAHNPEAQTVLGGACVDGTCGPSRDAAAAGRSPGDMGRPAGERAADVGKESGTGDGVGMEGAGGEYEADEDVIEFISDEFADSPEEGRKAERDSEEGKKAERDSGEGKKAERDSGEGKKAKRDSGEGKKAERDWGEGKKAERDSGEGKKAERDSGEGKKVERDSEEGKTAERDSEEGKKAERDSEEGRKAERCEEAGERTTNVGKESGTGDGAGMEGAGGECEADEDVIGFISDESADSPEERWKAERGSEEGKKVERDSGEGKKVERDSGEGKEAERDSGEGKKAERDSGEGKKRDSGEGKKAKRDSGEGKKAERDSGEGKKAERDSREGKKAERDSEEGRKAERCEAAGERTADVAEESGTMVLGWKDHTALALTLESNTIRTY
ncbi:unnamed protein product [Closterium sp. Naga37s-1]|nr:unnamed protein product [Closterium sp. Naga37s-1]